MPLDELLPLLRTVVLAAAAMQLLCATVLWRPIWRMIGTPWTSLVDQARLPAFLHSERSMRIISGAVSLIPLGAWWALGHPAVIAILRDAGA